MNLKNRLPACITSIKKGKLNAQVDLDWKGVPLSVIITTASAEEMSLEEGDKVEALFKASDVILAKDLSGILSARNIFGGSIDEVIRSFPLAMVNIESGGCSIRAEITLSSLEKMSLEKGDPIQAVIKSSELILSKGI